MCIRDSRQVTRTTVLNLVDRLEKRGWLARGKVDSVFCYRCLLYTSDAADERSSVDLGGRRIIKKKKHE